MITRTDPVIRDVLGTCGSEMIVIKSGISKIQIAAIDHIIDLRALRRSLNINRHIHETGNVINAINRNQRVIL